MNIWSSASASLMLRFQVCTSAPSCLFVCLFVVLQSTPEPCCAHQKTSYSSAPTPTLYTHPYAPYNTAAFYFTLQIVFSLGRISFSSVQAEIVQYLMSKATILSICLVLGRQVNGSKQSPAQTHKCMANQSPTKM